MAHSVTAKRLACSPCDPVASFSDTVAIRQSAAEYMSLPAGFLVESLDAVAVSLATMAVSFDGGVQRSWRSLVAIRLAELLKGAGHDVYGPLKTDDGARIHSVVSYGPRQVLIIDLVAELTQERVSDALDRSSRALREITSGSTLRGPTRSVTIPVDATVGVIQAIASTRSGFVINATGPRPMSFLDLLRIVRCTVRERSDIWYYAVDRQQTYEGLIFATDETDIFEVWRDGNKTLNRIGRPITGLYVGPGGGEEEWKDESLKYELERSLLALQMRPARKWPIIDFAGDVVHLCDLLSLEYYEVLPWEIPISISAEHPERYEYDTALASNLMQGTIFLLRIVRDTLIGACKVSDVAAVRIEFRYDPHPEALPLRLGSYRERVLSIYWSSALQHALIADVEAVQLDLGHILANVFAPDQRSAFLTAWESAPPAIRIDVISIEQYQKMLSDPLSLHCWHRGHWTQKLLSYLFEEDIECKTYSGEDAKRLDTETIYPWLLNQLHKQFDRYNRTSILEFALTQLEALYCKRRWTDLRLAHKTGFPIYSHSGVEELREEQNDLFTLSRAITLIVEELLVWPTLGDRPVDGLAWLDLLSLADLCVESCSRSELLHMDLSDHKITISESYDISMDADVGIRVDLAAYGSAVAKSTAPESIPIGSSLLESYDSSHMPESITNIQPHLALVDASLREEHGFGLDAIIGSLSTAMYWVTSEDRPFAVSSAESLADAAARQHAVVPIEEYRHAVDWLALSLEDERPVPDDTPLIEHWELERRADRIITRPLVRIGSNIYVLPWTAYVGLRIFSNYITDSRLPWPRDTVGAKVATSLDKVRQDQNEQLERDCEQELSHAGIITRRRVKPNKCANLGMQSLSGEIDVLAVDTRSDRFWVIEVKDPYFAYSPRSMDRQVRDFHRCDGYLDKLRAKVADISKDACAIAHSLGVVSPDRQWDVRGLMATRRETPAAFADCTDISFCQVSEVRSIIVGEAT